MNMHDRLATMPDDALSTLRANAERLERVGTQSQRASATDLLPALRDEIEARRAATEQRVATAKSEALQRRVAKKAAPTARRTRAKVTAEAAGETQ